MSDSESSFKRAPTSLADSHSSVSSMEAAVQMSPHRGRTASHEIADAMGDGAYRTSNFYSVSLDDFSSRRRLLSIFSWIRVPISALPRPRSRPGSLRLRSFALTSVWGGPSGLP